MSGLERLARRAAARPLGALLVVLALALAGGALALGLKPSVGTDALVGRGSDSGRATNAYRRAFGEDAIVVLVREPLTDLVDTEDLGRLIRLEGCLAGKVPAGARPYGRRGGPCWKLAALKAVKVVYGPGTFLLEAANEINAQVGARLRAGRHAAEQVYQRVIERARAQRLPAAEQRRLATAAAGQEQKRVFAQLAQLAVRSGLQGRPSIDNPGFVNQIVFDPARGYNQPKTRFAYLFPNRDAAVVQVRLRAGLSDAERSEAIRLVREAVNLPDRDPKTHKPLFHLAHGGSYTVTGVPVVVGDVAGRVAAAVLGLLLGALAIMALTLALVFRARLRLLPLGVALAAAGITFGVMRLAGAELTMASVAVIPVLIGLAVDYAVQFQSRVEEQEGDVARGAARGARPILTAGLATVTGFLVLLLSPVPMVRGFGLLLVLGVLVALVVAFGGGAAALALARRPPRSAGRPVRARRALRSAQLGACELLSGFPGARASARRVRGVGRGVLAAAVHRPQRVLLIGLAVAALGWIADTQARVESDVTRLVPQNLSALRDLHTLQDETGIAGEVDVLVEAGDVTRPAVVAWMARFEKRVLARSGYRESRGCGRADLCPALSLPDLLGRAATSPRSGQVRRLLRAVPPYFSEAVINARRNRANLAFGIRLMPLGRQHDVMQAMRRELDPPPGVSAYLAGLPVLAAEANAKLSSPWRRLATLLLGLLAVGLALWGATRRLSRALVPLVPIALATGWAALVLLPVSLNPMSATLGALVIAIATEFSVLLAERYRSERAAGHAMEAALRRTYASTGAAVLVSGLTAVAGFGVLVGSDIAMLRGFGIVTVVDLVVALAGVLVVLPAVLVLDERGELAGLPVRALRAVRPPARTRRGATA